MCIAAMMWVVLVGIESNCNGIGARLSGPAGDLEQTRQLLSGRGIEQDELAAHFDLGPHGQVDRLEIRWPSGVVDVLNNISADQKIRVIEGQGAYHVVQPTAWEVPPPASLKFGEPAAFTAVVRPALFEADARIVRVTADLSSLGGAAEQCRWWIWATVGINWKPVSR